jgi:hypothetical protein
VSPRLKFGIIALLFAAPMVAAWLVYSVYPALQPEGRLNYGTLIDPARPLPSLNLLDASGARAADALRRKWSLLQLGAATCGPACREQLVLTRQLWRALGKDGERVQRVYVAPDAAALAAVRAALAAEQPDLVWLVDDGKAGARAADFFQPADPASLYLTDPHGNWLMLYRPPIDQRRLHQDLKRLLRFSLIG